MTIALLLATQAHAGGAPAALLPATPAGGTVLDALVSSAFGNGCDEVVVLTRTSWAAAVEGAVDAGRSADPELPRVVVVGISSAEEELARSVEVLARAARRGCGVAVVHGHLVADEVTLTPLLDGQGGNVVLAGAGPAGSAGYVPGMAELRTLRGRVVAASSPHHALVAATEHSLGALAVSAGAVGPAARSLAALVEAVQGGHAPDGAGTDDRTVSDVLGWLLVALVRGGITVTSRPAARVGVATLVTDPDAAGAALEQRATVEVDRARLQESVKREDGFFTTFLVSSWSPVVVRGARRLGLSPDAVTWLSMGLGVLAAVAFAAGTTVWAAAGAVLLYLAFVLDCVDGQLARVTRRFSARGAWLDAMFDRGKEYVVYAGLALGAVRAGDDVGVWLLAGAALALQTVRHTLDLGYAAQQAADVERLVRRDLADPSDPGPSFWEVGHAAVVPAREGAALGAGGVRGSGGPGEGAALGAGGVRGSGGPGEGAALGAGDPPATSRPTLRRRVILALRRAEAVALLKWAKRIVVLPIGERFALIGVLAVATTPRVLFLVLLAWGGLATAYTAGGRVVRSLA